MLIQKLGRSGLVAACLLPAACATTSYTRSGIALPAGAQGKAGSDATLEIQGLKLRVETLDRTPKQQAIPRLALRLVFEPRELGYSFDPTQVVLRGADGAAWKPSVYGPGRFATAAGTCAGVADTSGSTSSYHLLAPGSCFELAFDVVVEGQMQLDIALDGLARGSQRLDPVALRVARRSGRTIDRVYWLEALVAPLALARY